MNDQAHELRNLVRHSAAGDVARRAAPIALGVVDQRQGGAGTTTVALNLAVALRRVRIARCWSTPIRSGRQHRPVVPAPRPLHFGRRARRQPLSRRDPSTGPGRDRSHSRRQRPGATRREPAVAPQWLISQLESLDARADVIVIDGGSGLSRFVLHGWPHCDVGVVITTPDAASIMNSYALMKILMRARRGVLPRCLVNFAPSAAVAEDVQARIAGAWRDSWRCGRRPSDTSGRRGNRGGRAGRGAVCAGGAPSAAARQTDRLAEAVLAAESGRQSGTTPGAAAEAIHVCMTVFVRGKGVKSNLPVGPEGALHKLDLTPFSRDRFLAKPFSGAM